MIQRKTWNQRPHQNKTNSCSSTVSTYHQRRNHKFQRKRFTFRNENPFLSARRNHFKNSHISKIPTSLHPMKKSSQCMNMELIIISSKRKQKQLKEKRGRKKKLKRKQM